MHEVPEQEYDSQEAFYEALAAQARALVEGEPDPVANAANLASLIFHMVPRLNWAGFYFLKDGELVVGPFQGRPACVRIPLGKGVCGTAAARRQSLLVEDVDAFPGHIPCDAASRSELVVPIEGPDGKLIGVLDLDSPERGRFGARDARGIEAVARVYSEAWKTSPSL